MPGMPVARLKVLVEADTRSAERTLAAFHRHLEESFGRSGEKAGKAADRGVAQGFDRDRNLISRAATKAGGNAGDAFSNSFAEKVARQAGGVLLKGRDVKVKANLDSTGLRSQVARAAKVAGAGQEVRIRVRADTSALDQFRNALKFALRDTKGFRSEVAALAFPVMASGIGLAASALSALGSAAIGAAASVAPLVGLLGALPGLGAAAGQGFGVLKLAFGGVGDAVKELSKAQVKSGVSATQSGAAQRTAAAAVYDATRRVQDAQQNLTGAQQDARRAQQELTGARRDARRALIDLRMEVQADALSEERALLSVREARAKLNAVRADPTKGALERADADLTYREALQQLKEVRERRRRNAVDLVRANREGVSGSEQVRAANERIVESHRQVAEATQQVVGAQRDLADAVAAAGEKTGALPAALQSVQEKLAALSPAGQRFVKFLDHSFKPLLKRLQATAQEGLFPGLTRGMERLKVLEPLATRVIGRTARMFGRLAEAAAEMVTSGPWQRDLETIGNRNAVVLERGGQAALNVADALRNVAIAAGPLVDWLSKLVLGWSESAKTAAQAGRDTGRLQAFFEDTRRTLERWLRIGGNVAAILHNIGKAARPLGDWLTESLDKATASMAKLSGSARGQNELRKFFDEARPALREIGLLARDVAKAFISISRDPELPKVISQIRTDLLPVLVDFLHQMRAAAPVFLALISTIVGGMLKLINTVPGLGKLVGFIVGLNVAFRALRLVNTALGINAVARALLGVGPGGKAIQFLSKQLLVLAVGGPRAAAALTLLGNSAVATGIKFRTLAGLAVPLGALTAAAAAGAYTGNETFKALDSNRKQTGLFAKQRDWLNRVTTIAITKEQKAAQAARDSAAAADENRVAYRAVGLQYSDTSSSIRAATDALIAQKQQLNAVRDASLGVYDAQTNLKQAQLTFKQAQERVNELQRKGKTGTDEYTQAVLDLRRARSGIVQSKAGFTTALNEQANAIRNSKNVTIEQVRGLIKMYERLGIKPPKKLLDFLDTLKDKTLNLPKSHTTTVKVKGVFIPPPGYSAHQITGSLDPNAGKPRRSARGGRIPGSGNSDSVPALLTPGEFVIRKSAAKALGTPQLQRLNRMRAGGAVQQFAYGGPVLKQKLEGDRNLGGTTARYEQIISKATRAAVQRAMQAAAKGFADIGGDAAKLVIRGGNWGKKNIAPIQRWLLAQDPKPYRWGAAGPGSFDCSGIASAVYGMLTGRGGGRGQRYFTTGANFPALGFRPGNSGPFAIGVTAGRGHMAGRLGNLKFEARSTKTGIFVGPKARSVGSFARQFYLPAAGSRGPSAGKQFATGGIIPHTGSFFGHAGEGVLNRRAMRDVGTGGLNAMNHGAGGVGGVYIAPGAVQIVVQGDIAGGAVLQRLEATVDRKLDDLAGQILAGRRS